MTVSIAQREGPAWHAQGPGMSPSSSINKKNQWLFILSLLLAAVAIHSASVSRVRRSSASCSAVECMVLELRVFTIHLASISASNSWVCPLGFDLAVVEWDFLMLESIERCHQGDAPSYSSHSSFSLWGPVERLYSLYIWYLTEKILPTVFPKRHHFFHDSFISVSLSF